MSTTMQTLTMLGMMAGLALFGVVVWAVWGG
jgi:hypothetical protein